MKLDARGRALALIIIFTVGLLLATVVLDGWVRYVVQALCVIGQLAAIGLLARRTRRA